MPVIVTDVKLTDTHQALALKGHVEDKDLRKFAHLTAGRAALMSSNPCSTWDRTVHLKK